jgi:hypothetical protein
MNLEIITKADLNDIKRQIVAEVVEELKKLTSGFTEPEYVKGKDVKRMLGCSDSKLESLRRSGQLPVYKLQGTIYYKREDINKLFES